MSVGAGPSSGGGLWMGGTSDTRLGDGNGNITQLPGCSTGGGTGAAGGGSCSAPGVGNGSGDQYFGMGGGGGAADGGGGGAWGGGFFSGGGYQDFGMWQPPFEQGIKYLLGFGVGSSDACQTQSGGPNPPLQPTSGAFSQEVTIEESSISIEGMMVLCTNTGVTLASTCDGIIFCHPDAGSFTYILQPGYGTYCSEETPQLFGGNQATVPNPPATTVVMSPM